MKRNFLDSYAPKLATITDEHFQIQLGGTKIFRCSECNGSDIKEHYKYCPFCNSKLIFKLKEKNDDS